MMRVSPGDERFFALAIQTVLYHNKHRLYLLTDSGTCDTFLKEMSSEIMEQAQTFKLITETAVREMESQPRMLFQEGVQ